MPTHFPRRRFLAAALAGLAAPLALVPPVLAQSADDPVDTVKALFAKRSQAPDAPFMSARLKRLFAAQRHRARTADGPLPGLDFDYLCNCQEEEDNWRQTLRYEVNGRTDRTAKVIASFKNYEQRQTTFSLVKENGKWLIDEIHSQGSDPMSRLLQMRD
jgi:Protein of unknown function (DUF3828)